MLAVAEVESHEHAQQTGVWPACAAITVPASPTAVIGDAYGVAGYDEGGDAPHPGCEDGCGQGASVVRGCGRGVAERPDPSGGESHDGWNGVRERRQLAQASSGRRLCRGVPRT